MKSSAISRNRLTNFNVYGNHQLDAEDYQVEVWTLNFNRGFLKSLPYIWIAYREVGVTFAASRDAAPVDGVSSAAYLTGPRGR